jgi:hypothetical protein
MLEIGCDQREAVGCIADAIGAYAAGTCRADYGGRDRVLTLRKKNIASVHKDC